MTDFTIKRFSRRHNYYIGVWKKGRRGLFALFRVKGEITKKKVIKLVEKKIIKKKEKRLYRVIMAMVCKYKADDFTMKRIGQIRVEVETNASGKYTVPVMRKLLKRAVEQELTSFPDFRKAFNRYVDKVTYRGYDNHIINESERRIAVLDNPMADIVGFGLASRYGTIRFGIR